MPENRDLGMTECKKCIIYPIQNKNREMYQFLYKRRNIGFVAEARGRKKELKLELLFGSHFQVRFEPCLTNAPFVV